MCMLQKSQRNPSIENTPYVWLLRATHVTWLRCGCNENIENSNNQCKRKKHTTHNQRNEEIKVRSSVCDIAKGANVNENDEKQYGAALLSFRIQIDLYLVLVSSIETRRVYMRNVVITCVSAIQVLKIYRKQANPKTA